MSCCPLYSGRVHVMPWTLWASVGCGGVV